MTWFKVDDAFYRGKKVRRLGTDRLAAVGLWTMSGNWAADNIENNVADGFVPWEVIEQWDPKRRYADRLIAVGLWEEAEHDSEHGVQFHDWPDYQPTAEQVRAERAAAAERQRRMRESRRTSRVTHGVTHGVTTPVTHAVSHDGSHPVSHTTPSRPVPSREEEPLRGSSPRKRPATPLPADWQPTDTHQAYATEHRLDLDREVFKFRHHADANDRRQASWNGAFSTWLANADDFAPRGNRPQAAPRYDPKTGRAVDW